MSSLTRSSVALALIILIGGTVGCRRSAPQSADVLPGRSRPVLEHGWAHPRDLKFTENRFSPADAQAALVTTVAGLRTYVIAADGDPVTQIVAVVPFGRLSEQAHEIGAADIIARSLQQDVGQRLGASFVGRVQVEPDSDLTRIVVQTFAADWRNGLAAVIGALRETKLDPSAVDSYRTGIGYVRPTRNLGGIGFRPAIELARLTAGRPIAPPDAGLRLRYDAVAALAARSIGPKSVVLGIGGGVPRAQVDAALNELTTGWTATAEAARLNARPAEAELKTGDRFLAIDEPGATTWLAVGHPMPALAQGDEASVAVMTQILNIRLNIAIREIRGLANQVTFQAPATSQTPGLLHVRSGARPESIGPIVRYVKEELSRLRDQAGAPTADEIEQAKGGLILSQWQRSLDGARATSATYAAETAQYGSLDRLQRWPDAVRAVTPDQVRAAAARYIQPEQLATVIIGQLDAVRTARHPRWPAAIDELTSAHGAAK